MTTTEALLDASILGKKTEYDSHYDPSKLFPIARKAKREEIGVKGALPFHGFDRWNHYEISWLNEKGKPVVAIGEIVFDCDSENIIESKSMKLYFNSFNNTVFKNVATVEAIVQKDFEQRLKGSFVTIRITPLHDIEPQILASQLEGTCIDSLDIECSDYHANKSFLTTDEEWVEETLHSDLLKSNCLVTNQPDWCSVKITYKGRRINHEGLLRYIVSFRNDNEFHEQCIEKIFMQILQQCQPEELTVLGRSTRRGGLDINSCRSTKPMQWQSVPNVRLCRQ
jgi:7-cyano-7-deazaguanine reductase